VEFEALKGLLRRVAEEVEAEIRQVEKELAEARRVGAKRQEEELSAIRDILYEDKWFKVATAVYAHLKKLFAKDGKAGKLLEAAERRLYGPRLEVIEAPLLKIKAAVDQGGKVAAGEVQSRSRRGRRDGLCRRGAWLQAGKDSPDKQDSRRGRGRQT